jgi:hypothetical protein
MNKAFAATDTRVDKLKYKFTSITSTSFTMDVTEDSDTANQFNGNVHYLVWDNGNKYGTLEDVVAKLETDSKDTIKYPELAELNGKSQDQIKEEVILNPQKYNYTKSYVAKGSKKITGTLAASISASNLNVDKQYSVYIVVEISGNYYEFNNSNGIRFNTNPFPKVTEFEIEDSGEHIDKKDSLSVIKGVTSNREGELKVYFDLDSASDVKLVNSGKNIQLLEMSTKENFIDSCEIKNKTLIIHYKPLRENQEYVLIVDGNEVRRDDSGIPGIFNVTSQPGLSSVAFYTEKRPTVVNAFFNPGNDNMNFDSSPFYMANTNPIYQIPDLIGVNKIGVGVNQALVLSFDDRIEAAADILSKISIDRSPYHSDLRYNVEVSENGMDLLITFDTDHPDRMLNFNTKYTVTIGSGAIKDIYGGEHSENEEIKIIFKTVDGFNNAFLQSSAQDLNNGIFRDYSTHNIAVKVPKVYIKQLETIHYRNGLVPDEQVAPNLTNIDIEADEDVYYMKIVTNRGIRPKVYRGANDKFSVAFAGLNADISTIEVYAYDSYGKILERRSFKLQGAPGSEFKNDYVPEISPIFGKTVSFYDLMKDPTSLQQIIEQIPLSELDRIGVFYPYFQPYNLVK